MAFLMQKIELRLHSAALDGFTFTVLSIYEMGCPLNAPAFFIN